MLTKYIDNLTRITHKDAITTLGNFIDYCLWIFGVPCKDWQYAPGVGVEFYKAFVELMKEYKQGINRNGWCDPLGDCFMELIKGIAKYRGQYFTPEGLCTLMADMSVDLTETGKKCFCGVYGYRSLVNDPTCGSGRNLLAIKAKCDKASEADQPYFIGEDIDTLCVKMTAINMCVHGCYGEAICHDTLTEPDKVRFGYVVNIGLHHHNLPGIYYSEDPRMFETTTLRHYPSKKTAAANTSKKPIQKPAPVKSGRSQPVQLDLFGQF